MVSRVNFGGGMAFPYFARIVVPESIDAVATDYLSWAMGTGRYAKFRQRRLGQGIMADWKPQGSLESIDLFGKNGLSISTRTVPGTWAFRFVHQDASRKGEANWWNVVRVSLVPEGCQVEHAVVRQTPQPEPLPGKPLVPVVLRQYMDRFPEQAGIRMGAVSRALRPEDIETWAEKVLLAPGRAIPALVISQPNALGAGPLVNPDAVATGLRGMATVAHFADKRASWIFKDYMASKGFDGKLWGCYDGAVRLFLPQVRPIDTPYRHKLWLAQVLADAEWERRQESVIVEATGAQVRTNMPPRFILALDDLDHRTREEAALSQVRSREADHEGAQARARDLEAAVNRLHNDKDLLEKVVEIGDSEIGGLKRERDELQSKLHNAVSRLAALMQSEDGATPEVNDEILASIDAVSTGEPTLVEALTFLSWRYPNRVKVLDKAWKSARKATKARFIYSSQAFKLMRTLVTDYWEILAAGGGDAEARRVFGEKYAARESETTSTNKTAKRQREATDDNGRTWEMWRHLRIGVSEGASEGWRCHFDWDADAKQIVIGWCAWHLDFD